jgi:hypothetical protein
MAPVLAGVTDPLPHNVHDHLILVTANTQSMHIRTGKPGLRSATRR